MNGLYSVLFSICFWAFLLGCINPKWVLLWGKVKTRKKAMLFFGSATIIFFILFGVTTPSDNSVEEKNTNIQNEREEVISTTQNIEEENEKSHVLNNEGKVISTGEYFPIKEKKSYIQVERDDISRQKWWIQWEGKTIFDNREAYKISTLTYFGDVVESDYFDTLKKWYDFYEIDDDGNIIKIGKITQNGEIKVEDPPMIELLAEMEIGKKYITSEDHYLKCLGFSDANLPNGQIYNECLVIDNVFEIRIHDGIIVGVFHKIQYFKKNIGCVMIESRQDNFKDGVFKKGKIYTTYLLKTGYPKIIKEVYEYYPIEYLKLDKVLDSFSEDRWKIKIKNKGQINKEHFTIISKEVPHFTINIWTNGNDIEKILGLVPLVTGDKDLDQLSLDYFQATLYIFYDKNIEVMNWILSDETREKAIHNNGEEGKSIEKIFNNIKVSISYVVFSDGMLALYDIKHKEDAIKRTFYVDPQKIQDNYR
jgi:hypothetical protein